jgi:Spherulation-specific family 4
LRVPAWFSPEWPSSSLFSTRDNELGLSDYFSCPYVPASSVRKGAQWFEKAFFSLYRPSGLHATWPARDRAIWAGMTKRGKTLALAVLVATTFTAAVGAASQRGRTAPLCQNLGVPAYFRPGQHWDRATGGAASARYLIMNPASGPGSAPDPDYVTAVRTAQDADVNVLGYVPTGYGRRDPGSVEAEIRSYRDWYDVDGVFLDEVTSGPNDLPYYRRLVAYARTTPESLVALNPGVYPDHSYVRLADLVVTFEGGFDAYRDLHPPPRTRKYPPSRVWHLVHTTDERDMSSALTLARRRRVGTVYVTDGTLDNPWDTLPSYWRAEQRAVAAATARSCPAG